MMILVRNILILSFICMSVNCSGLINQDESSADKDSLAEECMNLDGVYKGTITNNYTNASAPMLLDVVQNGCVVNGFIEIETPLYTTGIIHGWVENNELNFMALDRQRMNILREELHFKASMGTDNELKGTFYSLDPNQNVNDEGVWEVVSYNPLASR